MPYVELHCLTCYSFLRGASHPQELVERAAALGYGGLAITDECSLAGAVKAHVAAREYGLPLIVGSEFRLVEGVRLVAQAPVFAYPAYMVFPQDGAGSGLERALRTLRRSAAQLAEG